MSFRFLHCADVHLGAHLSNNIRYEDFFTVFAHMVRVALQERVDAFVIAGDFFHHRSIDARTLSKASELLKELKQANIPVIMIEGNHDKAFYRNRQSWLEFLDEQGLIALLEPKRDEDGFHVSDKTVWENDAIRFLGFGYLGSLTEQRIAQMATEFEKIEKPTVVLLHTGINRLLAQDMSGVRKEALNPLREKVDYIALGHIHGYYEIDAWAYNPGAAECVHIDEGKRAKKGFFIVELGKEYKKVDFFESPRRATHFFYIDIATLDEDDWVGSILDALPDSLEEAMVQVSLQGIMKNVRVDLRSIEKAIMETKQCLEVEVINETKWEGETITYETLDRTEMEKYVFQDLAEKKGIHFKREEFSVLQTIKQGLFECEKIDDLLLYVREEMEDEDVD